MQSAFFQLKLGKGFFKSFSKTIGKDKDNKCFKECNFVQTPKHLLLNCNLYREERREMQRQLGSSLSLRKLFCTKKGREVLFLFLNRTGIATRKWFITEGALEGGDSY